MAIDPILNLQERIKANSLVDGNGCWLWQKRLQNSGYGQMTIGSWTDGSRKNTIAHRVSYEAFFGKIPEGLQIDHLCNVRSCVNPKHLEAVTPKDNVHRSNAMFKRQMAKTHCPHGHEYKEGNMYVYPSGHGGITRNCKTCMKQRTRDRYAANKLVMAGI